MPDQVTESSETALSASDVEPPAIALPDPFPLHRGGALPGGRVVYEYWGEPNARRDNGILVFTGLSTSAHAASSERDHRPGWWEGIIGPGAPLDTTRYFVVCVNNLGSCFGSTGPISLDPRTGQPYRLDFPALSIEDIAAAGRCVVDALDLPSLHAVIGPSMGGMTALSFIAQHPGRARQAILIASAARASSFAIAVRSLQREAIRRDPDWRAGHYPLGHNPRAGMELARKIGVTTYRSGQEWEQRFGRTRMAPAHQSDQAFAPEFEIESYLTYQAEKFVAHFDANAYLYLSRAMDWFDIDTTYGSLVEAMRYRGLERALVLSIATDILFPPEQQNELAAGLEAAGVATQLVHLPSVQGHDAFLVDFERFAPVIDGFFRLDDGAPAD